MVKSGVVYDIVLPIKYGISRMGTLVNLSFGAHGAQLQLCRRTDLRPLFPFRFGESMDSL